MTTVHVRRSHHGDGPGRAEPAPGTDEATPGTDEVVSVRNVSKQFVVEGRTVPVLDDVSMSVRQGSTVSIVGPSGCGKTTLLRMIQGLETTFSGDITILGLAPSSAEIDAGFVFQQPSLFPWFTVKRNIEFGLRLRARRGRVSADQRVLELLELVGLSDFATYRPHQLSGGMQQRVNLARALAIDPAVLLLDEPFSAVDTLTRERLQLVLERSLAELGTTAILVTHDIREAVFLGSKVVPARKRIGRYLGEDLCAPPAWRGPEPRSVSKRRASGAAHP
jgi:ABC-type nitrate/sulfonate/bicarbonate transport system ATPase subunit